MLAPSALSQRTPIGLAAEVRRLVDEQSLSPGERLPTVRDVAAHLGVSIGTVSAAWHALAQAGVIVSRGRAGTFVRPPRGEWQRLRVQHLAGPGAQLDLSLGTPDPELLPSLDEALARVSPRASAQRYHEVATLPELEALLRESWPVPGVETLAVVDGAMDGISRTLEQLVHFGDRVVVESPGFPYLFDLVEALGCEAVPVSLDADGIEPTSLMRALATRPAAVLMQPRAQNPTGVSMGPERARHLARIVLSASSRRRVIIIEDDHSAQVCSAPEVTLGRWLPHQVVHVRSFAKSHGPDLRIAAIGGPAEIIEKVLARRMLGPAWTSRLLQTVLLELLTSPVSSARVRAARLIYRDRAERLAAALRRCGVEVREPDGLNLWLPVADERAALVRLAASGIAVAPGTPFIAPDASSTPHVRVTAAMVIQNVRLVAEALAEAALTPRD